tara:strand:- start:478 stop:717 length:240 start_codon:yes stop_codon:yes gene_type:complete
MAFTTSDLIEHLDHNGIPSPWYFASDLGHGLFEVTANDLEFVGPIIVALQHHDDLSVQFDHDDQTIKVCHDIDILLPAN